VDNATDAINTLAAGKVYLGNATNKATEVTLSGDVTIDNAGVSTIGTDKVVTTNILDANVTTAKIADANITTTKILDANVTTAKIADANVTNTKLDKANIPLSGFGAAAVDVSLGANKLTGVADPTDAQDAATKAYVDVLDTRLTALEPTAPVVGDFRDGGVVFWVDATSGNGLVCAVVDQSSGMQWHIGADISTYATGTAIGTGTTNTDAIIAVLQGSGNYAASIARDYNGGGYTDWFLPSKDELNQLYEHQTAIGGFTNYYYWSSTEIDASTAWFQAFSYGGQFGATKGSTSSVRAVRAF
jgi:hypothetical protein